MGQHRERCWPVRPPEREVRPQKVAYPILRNHLQKLTDLNASPGVSQTLSETSVQLCMPGWSRVPAEKMLSGKIPGSVLGKQRQTNNKVGEAGCKETNCLQCSVATHPAKGNLPHDPQTSAHITLHFSNLGMKDSI